MVLILIKLDIKFVNATTKIMKELVNAKQNKLKVEG